MARQLIGLARKEETRAARLVEERRAEAEELASHLNLDRLLAERRRQEELERERAAEAEQARQLSDSLDRVRAALDQGHLEEAGAMLGRLGREHPNSAEVASLKDSMAERQMAVKAQIAEEAVEAAYLELTDAPAAAVARLERLDIDGLPPELTSRLFGAWAQACSLLCQQRDLLQPLRFAPYLGRGVVLAREQPEADYVVVSNLGMTRRLQPGTVVSDIVVARSRPLR